MIINYSAYEISLNKMSFVIEHQLQGGGNAKAIATNMSTASNVPIVVLYYWFYKNKGMFKKEILDIADFYGYTELLDNNENILLTLKET
jgi:hypothetical protein